VREMIAFFCMIMTVCMDPELLRIMERARTLAPAGYILLRALPRVTTVSTTTKAEEMFSLHFLSLL
jgi:hypothetical protein